MILNFFITEVAFHPVDHETDVFYSHVVKLMSVFEKRFMSRGDLVFFIAIRSLA